LPAIASLARLEPQRLAAKVQGDFAKLIAAQQKEIDEALSNGVHSPDGSFVVAPINLGGSDNNDQLVIRKGQEAERRYSIPYTFTDKDDYLWLDNRTILSRQGAVDGMVFVAVDAETGEQRFIAGVENAPQDAITFGAMAERRFWYQTLDGKRHVLRVPGFGKRAASRSQ
jgi:hypothetical protein